MALSGILILLVWFQLYIKNVALPQYFLHLIRDLFHSIVREESLHSSMFADKIQKGTRKWRFVSHRIYICEEGLATDKKLTHDGAIVSRNGREECICSKYLL